MTIMIFLFGGLLFPYVIGWQQRKKLRELILKKQQDIIDELLNILEFPTPSIYVSELQKFYKIIEDDKTYRNPLIRKSTKIDEKFEVPENIQRTVPCTSYLKFYKKFKIRFGVALIRCKI